MLDSTVIKKIEELVYSQPRSIQEIAETIGKNWRTADRYVEEMEENFGTVSTKVFRGGTRGALKVVYWASMEKVSHSVFQEKLEQEILTARKKEDFSAFDIYQYVPEGSKEIFIQKNEEEDVEQLCNFLLMAKKQILLFSGNLSFTNLESKKKEVWKVFEELVRRGVLIKVLCRVDFAGKENIEKLLAINLSSGKNLIEIRHDQHPLRGMIVDGMRIRLKDVKEPTGKVHELDKKMVIFYHISDKSWADWLSRIFWKKFSNSMNANKRLEEMKGVRM